MSVLHHRKCLLCGGEEVRLFLQSQDYANTQESFRVIECVKCEFRWTDPVPGDLKKYYEFGDYFSHQQNHNSFLGFVYNLFRSFRSKSKFRFMKRIFRKHSNSSAHDSIFYLDFGCGVGEVLRVARENGWQVFGVEVDERAREQALRKNLPIYSSLEEIPDKLQFDIISLWHVLEHVPNPIEVLQTLKNYLKPGGIIVIAVPNSRSVDASYYGPYWAGWDLPRHLYHFAPQTLRSIFQKVGLHLLTITPQWWDTYYVVLLSERYKGNSFLFALGLAGIKATYFNLLSATHSRSALIFVCQK